MQQQTFRSETPGSISPPSETLYSRSGTREVLVLALLYASGFVTLFSRGVSPPPPWEFLAYVIIYVTPLAYVLAHIVRAGGTLGLRSAGLLGIAGVATTALYHIAVSHFYVVLLVFGLLATVRLRQRVSFARPFLVGGAILFVGYAAVWVLNYVFAYLTLDRLIDPWLLQLDVAIYSELGLAPTGSVNLFPIVRSAAGFMLLENAYHFLFVEILLALFLLDSLRRSLRPFLTALFSCYLIGLAVFLTAPAVGPCIYFPDSFDPAFQHTSTYQLMQGMYLEYKALRTGGPLSGYGYFVAVPSLHVAVAVLTQYILRVSLPHFVLFLPINVLLIASTVLLGYHYLLDVPAGLALGAVGIMIERRLSSRHATTHHDAMLIQKSAETDGM